MAKIKTLAANITPATRHGASGTSAALASFYAVAENSVVAPATE
jgi:hypothetical protein